MRVLFATIVVGAILEMFFGTPASAATCSSYYQMCVRVCKTEFPNLKTCLPECPNFRARCMATGQWMSRKVQDTNVEKR